MPPDGSPPLLPAFEMDSLQRAVVPFLVPSLQSAKQISFRADSLLFFHVRQVDSVAYLEFFESDHFFVVRIVRRCRDDNEESEERKKINCYQLHGGCWCYLAAELDSEWRSLLQKFQENSSAINEDAFFFFLFSRLLRSLTDKFCSIRETLLGNGWPSFDVVTCSKSCNKKGWRIILKKKGTDVSSPAARDLLAFVCPQTTVRLWNQQFITPSWMLLKKRMSRRDALFFSLMQ